MLHISVAKTKFADILTTKDKTLTKEITNYWKKELLDISLLNDKIKYKIKKIDKLKISNGFGEDKPVVIIECLGLEYNALKNHFEFKLGYIMERRNTDVSEDYKDSLIQQLLREKEILEDKMHKDHLTNVYNRRKMQEDLDSFVNQNNASLLSAVFIDADRFKGINDFFGHAAGDDVLVYISSTLKKYADMLNGEVYRYGGEEFVILCFLEKNQLMSILDKLRVEIKSNKIEHVLRPISVSVSMGVSFWLEVKSKDDLIKIADAGVLKAKLNGRDRIEFG